MEWDLACSLISVGYIVEEILNTSVEINFLGSSNSNYSYMNGYEGSAWDAAGTIWNTKIRYLGVGAMVVEAFGLSCNLQTAH